MGLASYYRRFVKDYALIPNPLYDLTREDVELFLGQTHENAFHRLKSELMQLTILSYPMLTGGESVLGTVASEAAIGAILFQVQEGVNRVLAFGS